MTETKSLVDLGLEHLAVIMDGNGRYAKEKGQMRVQGHQKGAENVRSIVTYVRHELKLPYLTLYAFSTENWKRKGYEVNAIMRLLKHFAQSEVRRMVQNDIRVRFIGRRDRLPEVLLETMVHMERATAGGGAMLLMIAIDYGGRDEIVRAAQKLAVEGEVISEVGISRTIDTAPAPDPDLVVRTGGNSRTSNFLTWQTVYSEWVFTETLWPAFTPEELNVIVDLFLGEERRFGGMPAAAE